MSDVSKNTTPQWRVWDDNGEEVTVSGLDPIFGPAEDSKGNKD